MIIAPRWAGREGGDRRGSLPSTVRAWKLRRDRRAMGVLQPSGHIIAARWGAGCAGQVAPEHFSGVSGVDIACRVAA